MNRARHLRLSLDLLRGFRAAARHLSFTRAAQELFVALHAPFGREGVAPRGTFFVVRRPAAATRNAVRQFVAWLRSEVRRDGELTLAPASKRKNR
jgi:DNA-binding transcriptional LysR family regulator